MVSPGELKKVIASFTGRELSDQDIMNYAHFLKGSEGVFSEEKEEEIRSELTDIVMKNPGLAKRVAEEYNSKQDAPASTSIFFLGYDSTCNTSHQLGFVGRFGKNNRRLASAPDIYRYLKSLETLIVGGTHDQITDAKQRLKNLKLRRPLLTSTRLFYYPDSSNVKMVHNYGSPAEEQKHCWTKIAFKGANTNYLHKCLQEFPQALFETKDNRYQIEQTLSLIYEDNVIEEDIFPKSTSKIRKITCGTFYFGLAGIGLFKCGILWKEKWGNCFYKSVPKK